MVLDAVRDLPEASSMEDIMDHLRLLASVQTGLKESERGEGVPHERVAGLLDEWITKSSGRHEG
jgi:predicted transcriptional regulator